MLDLFFDSCYEFDARLASADARWPCFCLAAKTGAVRLVRQRETGQTCLPGLFVFYLFRHLPFFLYQLLSHLGLCSFYLLLCRLLSILLQMLRCQLGGGAAELVSTSSAICFICSLEMNGA